MTAPAAAAVVPDAVIRCPVCSSLPFGFSVLGMHWSAPNQIAMQETGKERKRRERILFYVNHLGKTGRNNMSEKEEREKGKDDLFPFFGSYFSSPRLALL